MNAIQNWFVPVLAACFLHGAIAVFPVHFNRINSEKHDPPIMFKLVSMPQATIAPTVSQKEMPAPKLASQKKIVAHPPTPRSRPQFKAKEKPQSHIQQPVHSKGIPASIDMATIQTGQALPGQVSVGPVGVPASQGIPGDESTGAVLDPITLSSDELLVYCPDMPGPSYPMVSRQLGEQGKVIIALELNKKGRVGKVRVTQSSGYTRLDIAAINAVNTWRCNPPVHNGHPVLAVAQQPFDFILH